MLARSSLILVAIWLCTGGSAAFLQGQPSNNHCSAALRDKKVLVHYMIWYSEPGTRVWTWVNKDTFEPSTMGCNNTQQLPTYYSPVSGAFASWDAEHIASDLALMKANCIDGVIVDFQQPSSKTGRENMDRSMAAVVAGVEREGLEFAIMYDTSSKDSSWGLHDVDGITADWRHIVATAKNSTAYLRDSAGNRLFFAFGKTPLPTSDVACQGCVFYSQDSLGAVTASGKVASQATTPGLLAAFSWIAPSKADPLAFLEKFYGTRCGSKFPDSPTPCVGAAYPGFKSIHAGYATLPRSTALLRQTLELCVKNADICQIVTWNDFTEGTQIQPSYWCDGSSPEAFLQVVRDFMPSPLAAPAPQEEPHPRTG